MKTQNYKKGYITLITVIVISAISLTIAVAMLTNTITTARMTLATEEGVQARAYANTCAEIALNRYRLDSTYDGDETISLDNGACFIQDFDFEYDESGEEGSGEDPEPTEVEITTVGQSGTAEREVRVILTQVSPGLYNSSWEEINIDKN